MFRPIVRMTAAVFVAGAVAFAVTAAPAANDAKVNGRATDQALPQSFAKADRLVVPVKGAACSVQGWPDFEPKCQFDVRETASQARPVRVIALR